MFKKNLGIICERQGKGATDKFKCSELEVLGKS